MPHSEAKSECSVFGSVACVSGGGATVQILATCKSVPGDGSSLNTIT